MTNDKGNEYAISLLFDSDPKVDDAKFIASTNPNEKYIHPIAEQIVFKLWNMDGDLGAQADEEKIKEVVKKSGFSHFKRAIDTPINIVYKVKP